jgi:hypothetical protein
VPLLTQFGFSCRCYTALQVQATQLVKSHPSENPRGSCGKDSHPEGVLSSQKFHHNLLGFGYCSASVLFLLTRDTNSTLRRNEGDDLVATLALLIDDDFDDVFNVFHNCIIP